MEMTILKFWFPNGDLNHMHWSQQLGDPLGATETNGRDAVITIPE
jgi:hypothetical protein